MSGSGGRPPKLTADQVAEIRKRYLGGEGIRSLAREFKVGAATISRAVSDSCETIKAVAEQVVAADQRLQALPVSERVLAQSLIDDLKAVSSHLARAAKYGSMTAHKLSHIAHSQSEMIDEAAPIESNVVVLKSVMAMTAGANEAAKIGLNLLAANKGIVVSEPPTIDADAISTNDPIEAARAYQRLIGGG